MTIMNLSKIILPFLLLFLTVVYIYFGSFAYDYVIITAIRKIVFIVLSVPTGISYHSALSVTELFSL
ncbi:hypothetical protein F4803DRAFT_533164, partial [Xylaria telfairii]